MSLNLRTCAIYPSESMQVFTDFRCPGMCILPISISPFLSMRPIVFNRTRILHTISSKPAWQITEWYIPKAIHDYSMRWLFQVGQGASHLSGSIAVMSQLVQVKKTHSWEGKIGSGYKWSLVSGRRSLIVKIDRTLFTNWSLKFQREKKAALHQFGTVLWLLALGGIGDWL